MVKIVGRGGEESGQTRMRNMHMISDVEMVRSKRRRRRKLTAILYL